MKPFDTYPGGGNELIGKCGGGNCRRGYCLKLQQLTGQTACAYCGVSLVDTYEHWLLMCSDHVVPAGTGKSFGIPTVWLEDYCNRILCCSGCNGFKNRFCLPVESIVPTDLKGFVQLRDSIFGARKALILATVEAEREFYRSRPWEKSLGPGGSTVKQVSEAGMANTQSDCWSDKEGTTP